MNIMDILFPVASCGYLALVRCVCIYSYLFCIELRFHRFSLKAIFCLEILPMTSEVLILNKLFLVREEISFNGLFAVLYCFSMISIKQVFLWHSAVSPRFPLNMF